MNYVCEHSVGSAKSCDFRTGTVILQQAIDRTQAAKLLNDGKTDLLKEFVSKKTGRKFEAFLVWKEGKVSFEFAPREKKFPSKAKKDAPPEEKIDFTGQTPVGACPKCKSKVFEGSTYWVCEKSQAETRKCTFKVGKKVLEQPVERPQMEKLLKDGRTDLLDKFISKSGKPFSAHLVLGQRGKVEFEFPDK
jgi:DNA topoisomerase-3